MNQRIKHTRRAFIRAGAASLAAGSLSGKSGSSAGGGVFPGKPKLAIQGGPPVRKEPFSTWPQLFGNEEREILDVLKSGAWFRSKWAHTAGRRVESFEREFAAAHRVPQALATSSGTAALLCALEAVDVQPGDEVLVSAYTFCASANVIFEKKALAVFVDTDPETFQLNPAAIEERITGRTRAIVPVDYGGYPCDMDKINGIAKKHGLMVIEDACQAHMAKYRGRLAGTLGDMGCFSFQVSKPLPAGEGGACISRDESLVDRARWYHDTGVNRKKPEGHSLQGSNFRMTEWQGAILREALRGLEARVQHVHDNAMYFSRLLADLEGFVPAKFVDGGERGSFYNFLARYIPEKFKGLERGKFLAAMRAEGIPVSSGDARPLSEEGFVEHALQQRGFKRLFSAEQMDAYRKRIDCPVTRQICRSSVVLKHWVFMGTRQDVEQVAEAVHKIYAAADSIT